MRNIVIAALLLTGFAGSAQAQAAGLFTGKDAEALIAGVLAKDGAGDDIDVTLQDARDDDVIASGTAITAQTDNFTFDKAHGRWQTILLLSDDGKNLAPIKLSGHFDVMTRVPVLKRMVQPPEIIAEDDVDWQREPLSHMRKNTAADIHDLIGKSPRHTISAGRPVRLDEVAGPTVVPKGTRVTLIYKSQNLEIKTFGEALEPGAKGDVIRVRNVTSKAVIQGTVESAGLVSVTSPDSNSAEVIQ